MKKITLILTVILAAAVLLCGCIKTKDQVTTVKIIESAENTSQDIETTEVVLSKKYLDKCGSSAQDWIDAHEEEEYMGYSVRKDGALVLELTEEQRSALQEYAAEMVESAREDFVEDDPDFKVEVSEDYRTADFFYYPQESKLKEAMCMTQMILYGCAWQIYDGCGEDEWIFTINIYNCHNGKFVTSGGTEADIHYSASDWK